LMSEIWKAVTSSGWILFEQIEKCERSEGTEVAWTFARNNRQWLPKSEQELV